MLSDFWRIFEYSIHRDDLFEYRFESTILDFIYESYIG